MGDTLIDGLEGLTKIEGLADVLFDAIYWLAVIFVILGIAYLFVSLSIFVNKVKNGTLGEKDDDYLDDQVVKVEFPVHSFMCWEFLFYITKII